jgi:competence protein ComEC
MARILLSFLTGIAAGWTLDPGIPGRVLPGVFLFVVPLITLASFFIFRKIRFSLRWIPGIILVTCIGSVAFLITHLHTPGDEDRNPEMIKTGPVVFLAEVTHPAVQKERTTRLIVRILAFVNANKRQAPAGSALLFIRKDDRSQQLFPGDRILARMVMEKPSPPANPMGFDQQRYCMLKGIIRTGFIAEDQWRKILKPPSFSLIALAVKVRERLLAILAENGVRGREYAVAAALLLGYTEEIDRGLMADYSASGAMHILSVSGMHVGVIFLFIGAVLGFLDRFRRGPAVKSALTILLIWFYALVTGLSPAVLRASAMLSLILIVTSLKRKPEILNILAASALFLLAWDPFLLGDIGLQLSFLAVAGIVIIYPPIFSIWTPGNRILEKTWSLVALSLAAQLATFPAAIFYFNQFPNYFILANLLTVPLSGLVIYAGILAIVFGSVPFLSGMLAFILTWLVRILNFIVHIVESMPGSVTHGIVLSTTEVFFLYGIILSGFLFLVLKKGQAFLVCLGFCILLTGSFLYEKAGRIGRATMTVYSSRNLGMMEFIHGKGSILVTTRFGKEDPFLQESMRKYRYAGGFRNRYRIGSGAESMGRPAFRPDSVFIRKGDFLGFYGKRIAVIGRKIPVTIELSIPVDYVILTGKADIPVKTLVKVFRPATVIIDASVPEWRKKKWTGELNQQGIRTYSVKDSGAMIISFNQGMRVDSDE